MWRVLCMREEEEGRSDTFLDNDGVAWCEERDGARSTLPLTLYISLLTAKPLPSMFEDTILL